MSDKLSHVVAKATKAEARYTPDGTRAEHCGICRHFQAPHTCNRITGPVVAGGWCRFFAKGTSS